MENNRLPYEYLSSRNGDTVKFLAKLKEAKYRKEYGLFLAEGVKLAGESLDKMAVAYALLREGTNHPEAIRLAAEAEKRGAKVFLLSDSVFDKVSTESAPQGIIYVLKRENRFHRVLDPAREEETVQEMRNERMILLSGIRDPGNLGTILRSAAAFGVRWVALSDCAELWNPKTVRASMGALFRVRTLEVSSMLSLVQSLQKNGRRVLAAALTDCSETLGSFPLKEDDVPMIGNEGHGLEESLIRAAGVTVKIPMTPGTESLNAGVAASILMWEMFQ